MGSCFIHKNHDCTKTRSNLLQQLSLLLIFATSDNCGHRFMGITRASKKGTVETVICAICGYSHILLQLLLSTTVWITWLVSYAGSEQSLGIRLRISYFNILFYTMLVRIWLSILVCSVKTCDFFIMRLLFQIIFMGVFIVVPKYL